MICGVPDPDPVCLEEAPTLPGTTMLRPFLFVFPHEKKERIKKLKKELNLFGREKGVNISEIGLCDRTEGVIDGLICEI